MTKEEKDIMNYFSKLTKDGLAFARTVIMSKICSDARNLHALYEIESSEYTLTCPYCESSDYKKNGHRKQLDYEPARNAVLYGIKDVKLNEIDRAYIEKNYDEKDLKYIKVQRFKCNKCGRTFSHNTNTFTQYSKLSLEILDRYLSSMLNNDILKKSAKLCNISVYTCFVLRHKILSMLVLQNEGLVLCGEKIEMDETYFKISYKGNNKNAKSNLRTCLDMVSKSEMDFINRKPKKRGYSDPTILISVGAVSEKEGEKLIKQQKEPAGISHNKICLVTGLDHNGNYIGMVANTSRPTIDSLHRVLDGHIMEGSSMVTDEMNSYVQFAKDNNIKLTQINSKIKRKGQRELQAMNSFHSNLKHRILDAHFGISSKYLNNYVAWFIYVLKKDGKYHDNLEGFRTSVFHTRCRLRRDEISKRPPISFDRLPGYVATNQYISSLAQQALDIS